MPELRKDPITGRWVIISTDRARRPLDFVRESVKIKELGSAPSVPEMKAKPRPKFSPTEGMAAEKTRQDGHCASCRINFLHWELKACSIAKATAFSIA